MPPMKSGPPRPDPATSDSLSVVQLARRWKLPEEDVRRMLGRQELGFEQVCGTIRVPLAEIRRYEESAGERL